MGDPSNTQSDPNGNAKLPEIDILWLTASLGCDGDTIAMTGATQPSIEDLLLGALPWIPKVRFYNPFLAYENGDDFVRPFRQAADGIAERPFILVVEGSIPDEHNKSEGYWASFGTDSLTGQPITTCEWIDRLAGNAWAIIATGTCATYGGIHAMEGNPTGCMGLPDYLGWEWKSKAGIPIVCVPGCPVQRDNMMETILYLLYMASGRAPMIPLDDALRPQWLFGSNVHEGCDRGGYYEQAEFAETYGSPLCMASVVRDRLQKRNTAEIARAFHRGVAEGLRDAVVNLGPEYKAHVVVLSGGVFQNEMLLSDFKDATTMRDWQIWTNHLVPPNDGGISLGQAAMAAFGQFDEAR